MVITEPEVRTHLLESLQLTEDRIDAIGVKLNRYS